MTAATTDPSDIAADVLVVGGGPAGTAAACVLAGAGHRVAVLERQRHPRSPSTPSSGELLSPRATAELRRLGIGPLAAEQTNRIDSVVLAYGEHRLERPWPDPSDRPDHSDSGEHGVVVRRHVLDARLTESAVAAGAIVLDGHTAMTPLVERGFVRGATVSGPDGGALTARARYLLVADGANSRFGRSIGTFRRPSWPYVTAARGSWATPHHDAHHVELALDLTGRDLSPLTGIGWVFPTGDGHADIGVGVWSTSRDLRSVSTTELLGRFVAERAERWGLDPEHPVSAPISGRVPVGASVGPTAGPAHLVVGDAAGAADPLTGAGVEHALLSGRLAGEVLAEALTSRDPTALQRYPPALAAEVETDFKIGRLVARLAGRPRVARSGGQLLATRPWAADAALRIALGALRHDRAGTAERLHRVARLVSLIAPNS